MRIFILSCSWILGIFFGSMFGIPLLILLCGLIPLPFILGARRKAGLFILLSCCLFTFSGASIYSSASFRVEDLTAYAEQKIRLEGMITRETEDKENQTQIEISAEKFILNDQVVNSGTEKVLLFVPRYPEYRYGDKINATGKLRTPPQFEGFDYRAYLARESIQFVMYNPKIELVQRDEGNRVLSGIFRLRRILFDNFSAILPEPQASLAQGMVLGMRGNISDDLKHELSVSGTAHILAISGLNFTIIAGMMVSAGVWLFGRRHYIYIWLAFAVIWFYALMTGMPDTVIRSAIMASVFLAAELLGRQKNVHAALFFCAALMAGLNPAVLWSLSFQLSFLAMLGLIYLTPLFQKLFERFSGPWPEEGGAVPGFVKAVLDSIAVSCGALLLVWPVIAFNFEIISVVSPISTLLVAPVLSPVILAGGLVSAVSLVNIDAAQIIGWVLWIFLSYMLWVIHIFAAIPFSAFYTGISLKLVWMYYLFFGAILVFRNKIASYCSKFFNRVRTIRTPEIHFEHILGNSKLKWLLAPLLAGAFLTSYAAATYPDDYLHVSFLDVGQGDSILIQKKNREILIDGGPAPEKLLSELGKKMPFWDKNLDIVILTHPHLDHISGLIDVLKRYKVNTILAADLSSEIPLYKEWTETIKEKKIEYQIVMEGQKLIMSDEISLEILNSPQRTVPEEELDDNCLVLKLEMREISFLFTADIGANTEMQLLNRRKAGRTDILKIAHHGSGGSSTSSFLEAVSPQIAVISVGKENTFGHPAPETLERLLRAGLQEGNIFRTDEQGSIEFTTDGHSLWVKTERQ